MSSNPSATQNLKAGELRPGEEVHQDQQADPVLKSLRSGSSRYELRTPKRDEIEQNVSKKRKAEQALPAPREKQLKPEGKVRGPSAHGLALENPCHHVPATNVSREVGIAESDFFKVVNRKIEVLWPLDGVWYSGLIKRYDAYNKLHHVAYDDGDEEWVSLQREKVRLLEDSVEFSRAPRSSNKRNACAIAGDRSIGLCKYESTSIVQKSGIDIGANVVQRGGVQSGTDVGLQKASYKIRRSVNVSKHAKAGITHYDGGHSAKAIAAEVSEVPSKNAKSNLSENEHDRADKQSNVQECDIGAGSHNVQKVGVVVGLDNVVQKAVVGVLQEGNTGSKRIKDSKQVESLGNKGLRKNEDGDFGVRSKQVGNAYSGDFQKDRNGIDGVGSERVENEGVNDGGVGIGSEQQDNAGARDTQKDHDGGVNINSPVTLPESVQEQSSSLIDQERSVTKHNVEMESTPVPGKVKPIITYYRKRKRNPIQVNASRSENDGFMGNKPLSGVMSFISYKTDGDTDDIGASCAKTKSGTDNIGDDAAPGNDMSVQERPVNAYVRKRKRNPLDGADTMSPRKAARKIIQNLEQPLGVFSKILIVTDALKIHLSPQDLRQPSYWPCVAPGLQLCNMGTVQNFELVRSESLEDLMLLLGPMLQHSSNGVQESSSGSAFQQLGAGNLHSLRSRNLPLWECLNLITMLPYVQMGVLVVDDMSNVRHFHFHGPFSKIWRSFALSLASLPTSAGHEVLVKDSGARSAILEAAVKSIFVWFSSGGLNSKLLACNLENIHWEPIAKQIELLLSSKDQPFLSKKLIGGESSWASLANHGGTLSVLDEAVFKNDQNADMMNGLQKSIEKSVSQLSSYKQHSAKVFLPNSKNAFGSSKTIRSFRMSFTSAPSFFSSLNRGMLLEKHVCLNFSQLHGLELSVLSKSLDVNRAQAGMAECNQVNPLQFLPSANDNPSPNDNPSANEEVMLSGPWKRPIRITSNNSDLSLSKPVKVEDNMSPAEDNWSVKSFVPSSRIDASVGGAHANIQLNNKNMLPALPILKLRRNSSARDKWRCEVDSTPGRLPYRGRGETWTFQDNMIRRADGTNCLMESSQSVGTGDDAGLKTPRSGRRGRPSRQSRQEKLKETGVDFSQPGSDLESLSCSMNILVTEGHKGWRESGAEVALKSPTPKEWVLDVKHHGSTRFTYKPQEPKIRKTLSKAPEQVHGKSNCYTMIWAGTKDWSLEFSDRNQWLLFKKMFEECYDRNCRAATVKNIPIPGVRLLNDDNSNFVDGPFVRPLNYIKQELWDDVDKVLSCNRVVYEMDSDDEVWLFEFNSNAAQGGGSRFDKVSDETFERVIDTLERAAFRNGGLDLTIDDAVRICSNLAPEEVFIAIYSHWIERRKKKNAALIRYFQAEKPQDIPRKHKGKSFKEKRKLKEDDEPGKFASWRDAVRSTGQHQVRNQKNVMQHEVQQQQDNGIPFGYQCSSHALGDNGILFGKQCLSKALVRVSDEQVNAEAAKRAAFYAKKVAEDKRLKAERLLLNVDLATRKAVKALRIAETKRAIDEARFSNFPDGTFSPNLSTDSGANENAREGSMGSPLWALTTYGH